MLKYIYTNLEDSADFRVFNLNIHANENDYNHSEAVTFKNKEEIRDLVISFANDPLGYSIKGTDLILCRGRILRRIEESNNFIICVLKHSSLTIEKWLDRYYNDHVNKISLVTLTKEICITLDEASVLIKRASK